MIRFTAYHVFTGRAEILGTIERKLLLDNGLLEQRRISLCGPGGVGKTQLAMRYARMHIDNYTSIFWIDARDESTTCQSLADVAERLLSHESQLSEDLSGPHGPSAFLGLIKYTIIHNGVPVLSERSCAVAKAILNWFAKENNSQWLLIYDNYDDPDAFNLEDYIPKSMWGHILITTRRLDIAENSDDGILVEVMDTIDALELLKKKIGVKSKSGQWSMQGAIPHTFILLLTSHRNMCC